MLELRWPNNLNFEEWLKANIEGRVGKRHDNKWPNLFVVATWWLWSWRNYMTFNNSDLDERQKLEWILDMHNDVDRAFNRAMHTFGKNRGYVNQVLG